MVQREPPPLVVPVVVVAVAADRLVREVRERVALVDRAATAAVAKATPDDDARRVRRAGALLAVALPFANRKERALDEREPAAVAASGARCRKRFERIVGSFWQTRLCVRLIPSSVVGDNAAGEGASERFIL